VTLVVGLGVFPTGGGGGGFGVALTPSHRKILGSFTSCRLNKFSYAYNRPTRGARGRNKCT